MNLGEKIFTLRTQNNMSQSDLADILDVSRQSISKWETGTSVPELDKIMKMCDIFDISMDEFTDRPAEGDAKPALITTTLSHHEIVGYILLAGAVFGGILCMINNLRLYFLMFILPLLASGTILLKHKDRGLYPVKWITISAVTIYFSLQYDMRLFPVYLIISSVGMVFAGRKYFPDHIPSKILSTKSLILSWILSVSSFTGFMLYRNSSLWLTPEVTQSGQRIYDAFDNFKMIYGAEIVYFVMAVFLVTYAYLFYQTQYRLHLRKHSDAQG